MITLDNDIYALSIGGTVFIGMSNDSCALLLAVNGPTLNSYESDILIRHSNLVLSDYLDFLILNNSTKVDIMGDDNLLNPICHKYSTPSLSVDNQLKTYANLVVGGTGKPLTMIFLNNNLNILLVTNASA